MNAKEARVLTDKVINESRVKVWDKHKDSIMKSIITTAQAGRYEIRIDYGALLGPENALAIDLIRAELGELGYATSIFGTWLEVAWVE